MARIITNTITLTDIVLRSIMLFEGADGAIQADVCYDVLQDNGTVYATASHVVVPIPEALVDVVAAQWASAQATALAAEGLT